MPEHLNVVRHGPALGASAGRPRWESLHALIGLAELYYATGNPDYRTTVERFWWSIVRHDRHNNGGFSSGEGAVGNPYDPGSIETCCTVAWIAYGVEILRLTGNSIVADELELSTLNQVVGYQFRDGVPCTYDTPMDGRRISAVSRAQAVLQAEHEGHTITLEDFGTVGAGGDAYRSWLPARTAVSAPFSTSNPGRTWRP